MSLLKPDPKAPRNWQDELPVTSRYTAGIAGERFLRAIKEDGQILGAVCTRCDHTYVPAVAFCERCLAELVEWVDVGTVGELHTFTVLFVDSDGTPSAEPNLIGFIRLGDGGLVHRLGGIEPDDLEIGMAVEAVFKPQDEREGSILDITHFRPRS